MKKDVSVENLLIEAEIKSVWSPIICLDKSNSNIFPLAKSVYFKLLYAHYHLQQSLNYSKLALNELHGINLKEKEYAEFVTNCNFDAMIVSLDSIMDILAKLMLVIYKDIFPKVSLDKFYFKNLIKDKFLLPLKKNDRATAEILLAISLSPEREWVHNYCIENKHEKTFYSAGAYWSFDDIEEKLIEGYNLKNRYRDNGTDKELNKYAPKLFKVHQEKICELGRSILKYKNVRFHEVDENYLKIIKMHSFDYCR